MEVEGDEWAIELPTKITLTRIRCTLCFFYTSLDFLRMRLRFVLSFAYSSPTFSSSSSILSRREMIWLGCHWLVRLVSLSVGGRDETGWGLLSNSRPPELFLLIVLNIINQSLRKLPDPLSPCFSPYQTLYLLPSSHFQTFTNSLKRKMLLLFDLSVSILFSFIHSFRSWSKKRNAKGTSWKYD